ncbi:hypothetical protein GGI17_000433, partial [Coemansia sp. S146]
MFHFPPCGLNMDPSDGVRCHWQTMQHNTEQRLMCKKILCIWKYVFRDATECRDLVDSEDFTSFDAKAAVDYYCSMVQQESIDGLISLYAAHRDDDDM